MTETTPRDLATALAAATVVADLASEMKEWLRTELAERLDDVGADSVRAELPDGTRVAKCSIVAPAPKASVTDTDALARYLATDHATEVVTTVSIREAFLKQYLTTLKPTADGHAVDPDTGEIIPGITFRSSSPYVSTRFDKEGRDAMATALRDGVVSLPFSGVRPALEGAQP